MTTMHKMLLGASWFNQNISEWDTSQVTDMSIVFWGAGEFNQEELRASFESVGLHNIKVIPQGMFPTPLAEVSMKTQWLFRPISTLACSTDIFVEKIGGAALSRLTSNLVAAGQKPV